MGGFRKLPESRAPDLLHTYFSLAGLSLCGVLQPLNVELNMSERAFKSAKGGAFRTAHGERITHISLFSHAAVRGPQVQDGVRDKDAIPKFRITTAHLIVAVAV